MKILVTGGAGYLGSLLVPKLLSLGHQVTVLDNFLYQQTPLLDYCLDSKLEIVRGDARVKSTVLPLLAQADVIYPLACLTGAPRCEQDPIGARTTNFEAVDLLVTHRSPQQWIIFPTTNSGYGVGSSGLFCTEESPLRPVSLYGQLKVQIEEKILQQKNTLTLRLATVFGLSSRLRLDLLVNDFVYRAYFDRSLVLFESHFKRNFLHIRDAVRAFVHSLDNFERMNGQSYNVGLDDANLSKKELCQLIQKYLPQFHFFESPVGHDPDQRNYIVSNEKIRHQGFQAQIGLEAGIEELIKGFKIAQRLQFTNL